LKNKAAYTHQALSTAECKKMNRAASHLVEAAKRAVASAGQQLTRARMRCQRWPETKYGDTAETGVHHLRTRLGAVQR
jgi:hypothetical protein